MYIKHIVLLILVLIAFSGCSNIKYLQEDERLHNTTKIKIESGESWFDESSSIPANLKADLYNISIPKLNSRWLGFLKVNLWLHNKGDVNKKGLKGFLARRLGEAPVLLDSITLNRNVGLLQEYLFNKGFYHNKIRYTVSGDKKVKVTYIVNPDERYYIEEINFPTSNNNRATETIGEMQKNTLVKVKDAFDIGTLEAERERIAEAMQKKGFFGFNSRFLHFEIDSNQVNKKLKLYLKLLPSDLDSTGVHHQYKIDSIYISLNANQFTSKSEFKPIKDNIFYYADNDDFKPHLIAELVDLIPSELFSKKAYLSTQNNLLNLGVFKFVKLSFVRNENIDSLGYKHLSVNINLTEAKKFQFSSEIEANSRQNVLLGDNFIGTAVSAFLANKNTFGGGERLSLDVDSGLEFDLRKDNELINTLYFNTKLSLSFPRFLTPFDLNLNRQVFNPSTNITLSNSLVNRTNDYTINATELGFDYQWENEKRTITHNYSPLSISFFDVLDVQESFQTELDESKRLQLSFEENVILGTTYGMLINNNDKFRKTLIYYRPSIELAGNVFSLLDRINPDKALTIAGVDYAQFIKLESDLRFYFDIDEKKKIATRFLAGIGVPLGQSEFLPYVKQYYAGGSNGIRAFQVRGIGPGSFSSQSSNFDDNFDRTGDLRLEVNVEYRFPIYSYLKGALFLDAGNVWTLNYEEEKPGGQFEISNFWEEMAMGIGVGTRLDFTYFILRLDTAMPIYRPDKPPIDRWVTDQIKFGDKAWRAENLNLSLGIGYPF